MGPAAIRAKNRRRSSSLERNRQDWLTRRVRRLRIEQLERRDLLTTLYVTNTSGDASVVNSLPWAVVQANAATAGSVTIDFQIPSAAANLAVGGAPSPNVFQIQPLAPLVLGNSTCSITIDGTSEATFLGSNPNPAGGPAIVLDGSRPGAPPDGVRLYSNMSVLDLGIQNFVGSGIHLLGSSSTVAGCFIGTDAAGSVAEGNGRGVNIDSGACGNSIGGRVAAARNLISGNHDGVFITGSGTNKNVVEGNYIGTNALGKSMDWTDSHGNPIAANASCGVVIDGGASGNTIGGTAPGTRNVISGNGWNGILIQSAGSVGNLVEGNYIGTDASGSRPLDSGNANNNGSGIMVANGACGNTIGGTVAVARNIISGNGFGIAIGSTGTTGNLVEGNYIGTGPDGTTRVPNRAAGIWFWSGGSGNLIGGSDPAAGNTIAYNNAAGVAMIDGSCTGNAIRLNSIHDNAGLGIDLGNDGVTPNDATNPDTGPNNRQNYPLLTAAAAGNSTTVSGTLHSASNQKFTLDLYATTAADPSGFGQGAVYLGSIAVMTDGGGNVSFTSVPLPVATSQSQWITATATSAGGDTSEFSAALSELRASPITLYVTNTSGDTSVANSLPWAVAQANATASSTTIDFQIPAAAANLAVGGAISPNVFQIQPLTPLVLNNPGYSIAIDGASEATFLGSNPNPAGGPSIVLDGSQPGAPSDGLKLCSNISIVNVGIQNFSANGVHLVGSNSTVAGCFVGTDATGSVAEGNTNGISIDSSASNNTIGGRVAAARNLISGNGTGVLIQGSGTTENTVEGNYIGTNALGRSMGWTDSNGNPIAANTGCGVVIDGGASGNTIGGTTPGTRNVISGNGWNGVFIQSSDTIQNRVEGNYIGTDASGSRPLASGNANNGSGIMLGNGASNNTIGGTIAAARNIISGNGDGVFIGGDGVTQNVVEGNYIGTNAFGESMGWTDSNGNPIAANANCGVVIAAGASHNMIGGTIPGARNVISGNGANGVLIQDSGTVENMVAGNYIGTDASGSRPLASGNGNNGSGIVLTNGASDNTIGGTVAARNLISGNRSPGIDIDGTGTTGNVVEGNYIGAGPDGNTSVPNGGQGIWVYGGASGNTIGGSNPADGNTITYNNDVGVAVTDDSSSGNTIRLNSIHDNSGLGIDLGNDGVTSNDPTNPDAGPNNWQNYPELTAATAGTSSMVSGTLQSASDQTFVLDFYASTTADQSGYGQGAVYLGSTTVTTDGAGSASFTDVSLPGASEQGDWITATATNVGGDTSEFSAALAALGEPGPITLHVTNTSGDASVLDSLPWAVAAAAAAGKNAIIEFQIPAAAANLAVGGAASPNVFQIQPLAPLVLSNPGYSITIDGASEATFLGRNPNPARGPTIVLDGSQPGAPGDGFQLSSNISIFDLGIQNFPGNGVFLVGSGSTVAGCFIGTDATGSVAEGNGNGVNIASDAHNNTIGGTVAAVRNVISGNGTGVVIAGGGATENVVEGNYIGTNAFGESMGWTDSHGDPIAANAGCGVVIQLGASRNTIGGTTPGTRNVISGNGSSGVLIQSSGTMENVVQGNYMGTDASGSRPLASGNANNAQAIVLANGASGNIVGGTAASARNIISGNRNSGIEITGAGTTGNVVKGNFIGTDPAGTASVPNGWGGIRIHSGAAGNTIGGSDRADGNTIAYNNAAGVAVTDDPSTGNTIRLNSIYNNSGLGIDLGEDGVTPNHSNNPATGPNNWQNYPVITAAVAGSSTTVSGMLHSVINQTFIVDFYASMTADPSGYGQGAVYLGSTTVTTDGGGNASFSSVSLPGVSTLGEWISATATDAHGDTSEFSGGLVYGGTLGQSQTWPGSSLHQVTGRIVVPSGVTLTIRAGAVVKFFAGGGIEVQHGGQLIAAGTLANPVVFTSIHDDTVGGDSNSDGNLTSPAAGDWRGILVYGGAQLDHVEVLYGGKTAAGTWDATSAAVAIAGAGTVALSNSTIRDSFFDGVTASGSNNVTVTNCVISDCDVGIYADIPASASSTVHIVNCTLDNNQIGIVHRGGLVWLTNSIVSNSADAGIDSQSYPIAVTYSDIWSPTGSNYGGSDDRTDRNGNISADPMYQVIGAHDFRLSALSPVIDAANGGAAPAADFRGCPRYDDPAAANAGLPMPGGTAIPDMGAFEFADTAPSSVDMTVVSLIGAVTAMAGDQAMVQWTDANIGSGMAVGPWQDSIYLVNNPGPNQVQLLVAQVQVGPGVTLGPGWSFTTVAQVRVPGGAVGNYYWEVTTNSAGGILEGQNSMNNTLVSSASVSLGLPALDVNGHALSGHFSAAGEDQWFQFTAADSQDVLVALDLGDFSGAAQIYIGKGYLPDTQRYDACQVERSSPRATAVISPTPDATYYVLVCASTLSGSGAEFSLSATVPTLGVRSVSPAWVGNVGRVTFTVRGGGLGPDTTFEVIDPSGQVQPLQATAVYPVNSTLAYVTFDLTGLPGGVLRALQATSPGLGSVTLSSAFSVRANARPGQVETQIRGPATAPFGQVIHLIVDYTNTGNSDVVAPMLYLHTDSGEFQIPGQTTWTPSEVQILGASLDGPAGILPPGYHGRWIVNFRANGSSETSNYGVSVADPSDLLDWTSLESHIRPAHVTDAVWAAAWQKFKSLAGNTWGGYLGLLSYYATIMGMPQGAARCWSGPTLLEAVIQDMIAQVSSSASGTLYLRDQRHPLANVSIVASSGDGSVMVAGTSAGDGSFYLPHLPAGTYTLSVPGYLLSVSNQLTLSGTTMLTGLMLTVTPGSNISGTIRTPAGNSLAYGVAVIAQNGQGNTYSATTDNNGNYAVRGLRAGTYTVTVGGGSLATAASSGIQLTNENRVEGINFTLPTSAAAQGSVVRAADSQPLAAVSVLLVDAAGNSYSAVTDPSGAFSFSGINPGTYDLTVSDVGYVTVRQANVVLTGGGSTTLAPLALIAGATLNLTLTDPSLNLLSDVTVTLSLGDQVAGIVVTDADGQAVFHNLAAGSYSVDCWRLGYGTTDYTVSIATGQTLSEVYSLLPAAVVQGTVSDGNGAAIAGITVNLVGHGTAGNPVQALATTAADGTYQIPDLSSGTYTLTVGNNGGINPREVTIDAAHFQQTVNISLAASAVRGKVLAADGKTPVDNASVLLSIGREVVATAQTDGGGDYCFRIVAAGHYLLSADTAGGISAVLTVDVAVGADVAVPSLALGGLRLNGTVTASGMPLAGATVDVLPLATGAQDQFLTALTDANGGFVVDGLVPGQYSVWVGCPAYAPWQQSMTIAGNLAQAVALVPGGVVQGTITDATSGLPVAGASVSLLDPVTHAIVASAATNASGQYQATGVAPGTYSVLIEEPAHQMTELTGVVVKGNSSVLSGTLSAKSTVVHGTVSDSSGRPLARATVTVVNGLGETMYAAMTAADGTWATDELPPGNYTVTVSATGYHAAPAALALAVGVPQSVPSVHWAIATDDYENDALAGFLGFLSAGYGRWSPTNSAARAQLDPPPKKMGLHDQMPPQPAGVPALPAYLAAFRAHDNVVATYEAWESADDSWNTTIGSCALVKWTRLAALLNSLAGILLAPQASLLSPRQLALVTQAKSGFAGMTLILRGLMSARSAVQSTVNAVEKGGDVTSIVTALGSDLSAIASACKFADFLAFMQKSSAPGGSQFLAVLGPLNDAISLYNAFTEASLEFQKSSNIVINARDNYLIAIQAYDQKLQNLAIANANCPPGSLPLAPAPPAPTQTQTTTFAPPPGVPSDYVAAVGAFGWAYPNGLPAGMVSPPAGYVGWWDTWQPGIQGSKPFFVGIQTMQVLSPSVSPRIVHPGDQLTVSCAFASNFNLAWMLFDEDCGAVSVYGVPGITLVSGNTIPTSGWNSWYYNDFGVPYGNINLNLPLGANTLVFQIPEDAHSGVAHVRMVGPYPGGGWTFVEADYYFQVIAPNDTHIVITPTPTSPVFGQPVTLAAQVSAADVPNGILGGLVDFFDQTTNRDLGTMAIDSTSTARLTVPDFGAGNHLIKATYSGDVLLDYFPSSATYTLSVAKAQTTTTIVPWSSPTTYGEFAGFTATVTIVPPGAGTLYDSINFVDSTTGANLGTVPVDSAGKATLAINNLGAGQHTIRADYTGGANFAPSQGQCTQQVQKCGTFTTPSSSPNLPVLGSMVTLTADVTSSNSSVPSPTGKVHFVDQTTGVDLGTQDLVGGFATITSTALLGGTNKIVMDYSGDNNFKPSAETLNVAVLPASVAIQTTGTPNPALFGQTVDLSVAVTPKAPAIQVVPTGTVVFHDDTVGGELGQASLNSSGIAHLSVPDFGGGKHQVSTAYLGDNNFAASTGGVLINVQPADTTTEVACAPNPSDFGLAMDVNTVVAPANASIQTPPSGWVTLVDQTTGKRLGSVELDAEGKATLPLGDLAAGKHTLQVTYNGDDNFKTSKGSVDAQIQPSDTTTDATCTPAAPVYGQQASLSVFVGPANSAVTAIPTGSVDLVDQSTSQNLGTYDLDAAGSASVDLPNLDAGTHQILVSYSGDHDFNTSSMTLSMPVVQAQTTTAVTTSGQSLTTSQAVTYTATVGVIPPGAGLPTGTVTFTDSGAVLGLALLDGTGTATVTTWFSTPGSHLVTAAYEGDKNFQPSSGSLSQAVKSPPGMKQSTVALKASVNPTVLGQAATLIATVSGLLPNQGTPTGQVTFKEGNQVLGTGNLAGGVALLDLSKLAVGNHTITAIYSGDKKFIGSKSNTKQVIKPAATAIDLGTSGSTACGQSLSITATVSVQAPGTGTPAGTVSFKEGAQVLATVSLQAGKAIFTTSAFAAGKHTIAVVYSGNASFRGSTASPLVLTIAQGATNTTVAQNPSTPGQPLTFTAGVHPQAPGSLSPTGVVALADNGHTLGLHTLDSSGAATFSTSLLSIGNDVITAVYVGDASFGPSAASISPQPIGMTIPTIQVSTTGSWARVGQTIQVTAMLGASNPPSATPTGSVEFWDETTWTPLGNTTLDASGQARLNLSNLPLGQHAILAWYDGDQNYCYNFATCTVGVTATSLLLDSSANCSSVGQAVAFTATAPGALAGYPAPAGSVDFIDDTTHADLGSAPVNASGQAVISVSTLSAGLHAIRATYGGDANYSAGSATLVQQVQVNDALELLSSDSTAAPGQDVTFTARVTGGDAGTAVPTGTVDFYDQTKHADLGSVALDSSGQATLDTSTLDVGKHTITAAYGGDASWTPNSALLDQWVAVASIEVYPSRNPAEAGHQTPLTIAVTVPDPSTPQPTGSVRLVDQQTQTDLGTAPLDNYGLAHLNLPPLGFGSHAIQITYSGDANWNGNQTVFTLPVTNASIQFSSSSNPCLVGQQVILTATLSALTVGAGTPTGSVDFWDESNWTLLGSATIDGSGQASLSTSTLDAGLDTILAWYSGDANFGAANGTLVQAISSVPKPQTMTWSAAGNGSWNSDNWGAPYYWPDASVDATVATPNVVAVHSTQAAHSLGVSNGGQVTIGAGGSLVVGTGLTLGAGGTVAVTGGGILTVSALNKVADPGRVWLDGGILRAAASFSTSVPVTIGSGGAVVDSNDFKVTLSGNIGGDSGDVGLTKSGSGTMVLLGVNSYNGGTTVLTGELQISNSDALPDGSSLAVGAGGTFIFDPSSAGRPSDATGTVAAPVITNVASSSLIMLATKAVDVSASGSVATPSSVRVSTAAGNSPIRPSATVATPVISLPLPDLPPGPRTSNLSKSVPTGALGAPAADRVVWSSVAKIAVGDLAWLTQAASSSDGSNQQRKKEVAILALDMVFAKYGR
jgi:autotransporter-associated beta strand protein